MKKKLKKTLSLICASLIVISSFTSAGALGFSATERVNANSVVDEAIETTEPIIETTPPTEATEALEPNSATEPTTAPVVKRKKKNLHSTGADIGIKSTGATSASGLALGDPQTLTSADDDIGYATDINGNKVALTVVKTRYATSNSSKYTYQGTDSKGNAITLGKPYKVVITCDNGAGDGSKLTATWTVDESTITSTRTEADGTGTLTISSGVTTAANKTTRDWSANGIDYTPWGVALTNSKITNVEIGYAIRTIGKNSFRGLSALKSITFKTNSNDVSFLKKVDEYAFYNCDGLTSLTLNGSHLNTIGAYAFYSCNGMKTLKITSDSLVTIGTYAFAGCACTALNLNISGLTTIGENAFRNCDSMTTLNINTTGLKTLGNYAFYDCDTLTTLTMTAPSLTKIETYTFRACDVIKTVTITANNLTSIGEQAFYNNAKLTTVTLTAESLKTLSNGVFQANPALVTATINADKLTALAENTFRNSFTTATSATSMVVLNTVSLKTIGTSAFQNCTALEVVRFRDAPIVTIGSQAFKGCSGLLRTSATDSNTLGKIPDGATSSSYSNILTLPRTVQTIEEQAFFGCTSIEVISYIIVERAELKTIGTAAFRNTNSLHIINLPNSLQTIGANAFLLPSTCTNKPVKVLCLSSGTETNTLTGVSQLSQLKTISYSAFQNNLSDSNIANNTIPKGMSVFDRATGAAVTKSTVFVFHNLEKIEKNAFTNNSNFVGQYLFKKNVWIAGLAFKNTNLTNIYCKYDGTARWKNSTVNSSRLGSTDVYTYGTSSDKKNYALTTDETKVVDGVTYKSLYHILTENLENWRDQVKGVGNKDVLYSEWVAEAMKETTWNEGDVNAPYQAVGMLNGEEDVEAGGQTNPVTGITTHSFLQTEIEWITPNDTAKETVTFGYKNPTCVDYIFVVDTSSSMDLSSNPETGKPYDGSRNVSKVTTAFSQVYSIAEKVLSKDTDQTNINNSVSVITFSGNDKNELKNSSKFIGVESSTEIENKITDGVYGGMRTEDEVYQALFNNEDGYESKGVTNWSSGLSRAYMAVEGIRKYNKSAGIENTQVVIFLTDGSPTYANGAEENAGGFSPIYTENESETALENGTTKKNPVMVQVNGVDWAKAIKGDTSTTYSARDYISSYYDPVTDTLDSTPQTVKGLGVEIFGILVGNKNPTKMSHLNKVTTQEEIPITEAKLTELLKKEGYQYTVDNALNLMAGTFVIDDIKYDSKSFASDDGDLSDLAKHLVKVISSLTSEDYVLNIPLDNNFKLLSGENNTTSISIIDDNGNVCDTYSFELSSNWVSDLDNFTTYGRIRYDATKNCIIWDLSDYLQEGGTTSSSFVTYQLAFDLKLQDKTTLTRGVSSENPYYSASTNNPNTSLNNFDFGWWNELNGSERAYNYGNYYVPYFEYIGAYAYINADTSLDKTPTQSTEEQFFMNYSEALYLPADVGGLNLYKKTDDNVAITGAEFQVYDVNGNLMSFYKNSRNSTQYSYYDTTFFTTRIYQNEYLYYDANVKDSNGDSALFTEIAPSGTSALASIVELPPGTYYLYESTFPTDDLNEYTLSDLDVDKLEIITCADGAERQCYKVVVSSDTTVSSTVHNTAIATAGRIIGYKVDQNGNYLAGATIGLYDKYTGDPTAKLLDTYVTKADGKYIFNVDTAGTYYIKEISAPNGYSLSTSVYSVTFTDADLGGTKTISSNIVNYAYAKIIVHVDGSDYAKENYGYTLTAANNSSVNYTGTTDDNGTYTFHIPHRIGYSAPNNFEIQQTSAPNDYYLTPEYSLNGFDDTVANTGKFTVGTVASGSEVHVYVYNPSVKITVNNYDGNDRTTPLLSDFKLNDIAYSTDENGSFNANGWFGYGDTTLVQTKVPSGYNLLAGPVTVSVTSNSIELAQDENGQRYYKHIETVYNVPTTVFPLTGGSGRQAFNTVAVTLLSMATVMGFIYLRRKGKMKDLKKES